MLSDIILRLPSLSLRIGGSILLVTERKKPQKQHPQKFFVTNKMEERLKRVEEWQREKHVEEQRNESYDEGFENGREKGFIDGFRIAFGVCVTSVFLALLSGSLQGGIRLTKERENANVKIPPDSPLNETKKGNLNVPLLLLDHE